MTEHYTGPEYRTALEIRAADGDPELTTLTIARFDAWNEIHDFNGRYLEMPTRGAYAASFAERGSSIKVLFNHGHDPAMGQRALGTPFNLREGENGPQADIQWIDRPYVDDIRAGIPPAVERSIYGVSYMFRVLEESWNEKPERSAHNPEALPERTLLRIDVAELGLVTFAADTGTEALVGVRSLTDRFAPPVTPNVLVEAECSNPGGEPASATRANIAKAFVMAQRKANHPSSFRLKGKQTS